MNPISSDIDSQCAAHPTPYKFQKLFSIFDSLIKLSNNLPPQQQSRSQESALPSNSSLDPLVNACVASSNCRLPLLVPSTQQQTLIQFAAPASSSIHYLKKEKISKDINQSDNIHSHVGMELKGK
ncbi:hypothetical protein CICLE_v10017182mg [Citrus x clementina]|uniref:Uncharacterized protein n=1 Tax=Citrus clementina TaxID=85681 RepID=V4TLT5_CITCL|nr:hypothetical protein CICLE_v10017182mg [Citrus x clementina]GAY58922.1 hypothetical protein CUMW_190560 [Citrus unshiu]